MKRSRNQQDVDENRWTDEAESTGGGWWLYGARRGRLRTIEMGKNQRTCAERMISDPSEVLDRPRKAERRRGMDETKKQSKAPVPSDPDSSGTS